MPKEKKFDLDVHEATIDIDVDNGEVIVPERSPEHFEKNRGMKMENIIYLIIGLIYGIALTYIALDEKICQQSRLIERLNRDLILEKHEKEFYHSTLREERLQNIENYMKS